MASSEQHPNIAHYRSYHYLLLDHLVLTTIVDDEGKIIDNCVSVVADLKDDTVIEINDEIFARNEIDTTSPTSVCAVGRDVRELFLTQVNRLHRLMTAAAEFAGTEAEVLQ